MSHICAQCRVKFNKVSAAHCSRMSCPGRAQRSTSDDVGSSPVIYQPSFIHLGVASESPSNDSGCSSSNGGSSSSSD